MKGSLLVFNRGFTLLFNRWGKAPRKRNMAFGPLQFVEFAKVFNEISVG